MKFLVRHDIRLNGVHHRAGAIVEMDCLPQILAGDLEPFPIPPAEKETIKIAHENKSALWRVGLFVTGKCNMNCAHCSQAEFRADHGDMDFSTVEKVCSAVKNSGRKMVFSVTGGEPTLWPRLYDAFKLAGESGCFPEAWLFSNGSDCGQVERLIADGLLTHYRTNAANCRPQCHELKNKYPKNVFISEGGHYPLIRRAVWNAIPAACNCPGVAVQGNRVWACPNFYSIIKRHNFDMEKYQAVWSVSVDEDWIKFFAENETKKYVSRMCMFCEANKKCQAEVSADEKVRRYSSGI